MKDEPGTLGFGEVHPAAQIAIDYMNGIDRLKFMRHKEAIASTALAGNKLANVAFETLRRYEAGEPLSDRYLMGLAWLLWSLENE